MVDSREWEPETGLYYYRARHYDPTIGRFLQPDPIGYADGLNMYQYVGSNPVIFVDPTGLILWRQIGRGISKLIGGGLAITGGLAISTSGVGAALGGAVAVTSGVITAGTGLGDIVAGLFDVDTSDVPGSLGEITDAAVTEATGSETAGDIAGKIVDTIGDKSQKLSEEAEIIQEGASRALELLQKGGDEDNKEDGDGPGDNNLHDVFIMSDSGGGRALARGFQPFRSPAFHRIAPSIPTINPSLPSIGWSPTLPLN